MSNWILHLHLCVPVCPSGLDTIGLSIYQKGPCVGVEIPAHIVVCVCFCAGRHLTFQMCFTLLISAYTTGYYKGRSSLWFPAPHCFIVSIYFSMRNHIYSTNL